MLVLLFLLLKLILVVLQLSSLRIKQLTLGEKFEAVKFDLVPDLVLMGLG